LTDKTTACVVAGALVEAGAGSRFGSGGRGLVLAAGAFFILAPLALARIVQASAISTSTFNVIGGSYQVASGIASIAALATIAISLYYQASQTKTNQTLALRTMHTDLMRIAMEDPKTYAACFGYPEEEEAYTDFRRNSFNTLRLRYIFELYRMGEATEANMRN
jgi:hypothetical protein